MVQLSGREGVFGLRVNDFSTFAVDSRLRRER